MANIYEIIMLIHVFGVLAISLVKIWNVLHKGEKYDYRMSIILFVCFWLFWFLGLSAMMTVASSQITDVVGAGFSSTLKPYEPIYIVLFRLSNLFIIVNVVIFIAEIFFYIGKKSEQSIQAYMSNDFFKK